MHTFDVLVWEDSLSDRSMGYSAWCTYVLGVSGQGDTEEEALAEVAGMITDVMNDPDDAAESLMDEKTAAEEMADLMRDLDDDGIHHWLRRVSVPDPTLAGV